MCGCLIMSYESMYLLKTSIVLGWNMTKDVVGVLAENKGTKLFCEMFKKVKCSAN